ncbi:hypothetical protein KCU65_g3037, partial [Aureobasidium melanogenum]
MNKQEYKDLINELWQRDDPQVMIVRYDDELERIGTQAETPTYHTNPVQAVDAFFFLLLTGPARRSHHYSFLQNDDFVPFGLYDPPFWVRGTAFGEYPPPGDEVQAQLLPSETEPDGPLLAEPASGPVPPANDAPPQEIRDMSLSLEARRIFACTFPGCSSRFTRPSDRRRHEQNVHRGHTQ